MNDTEFRIKPANGQTISDPETGRPLNAKGEVKSKTAHGSFWMRRLTAGDVEIVTTGGKPK